MHIILLPFTCWTLLQFDFACHHALQMMHLPIIWICHAFHGQYKWKVSGTHQIFDSHRQFLLVISSWVHHPCRVKQYWLLYVRSALFDKYRHCAVIIWYSSFSSLDSNLYSSDSGLWISYRLSGVGVAEPTPSLYIIPAFLISPYIIVHCYHEMYVCRIVECNP